MSGEKKDESQQESEQPVCQSCDAPFATRYEVPGGIASLCRACAVFEDLGCP